MLQQLCWGFWGARAYPKASLMPFYYQFKLITLHFQALNYVNQGKDLPWFGRTNFRVFPGQPYPDMDAIHILFIAIFTGPQWITMEWS